MKLKTDDTDEYQKELKLVIQTIDEIQSTINFVQDDDTADIYDEFIGQDKLTNDEIKELRSKIQGLQSIDFSNVTNEDINSIIDKIINESNPIFRQNMLVCLIDMTPMHEPVKGDNSYDKNIKSYDNLYKIFLDRRLSDDHNVLVKHYDEITKDCF